MTPCMDITSRSRDMGPFRQRSSVAAGIPGHPGYLHLSRHNVGSLCNDLRPVCRYSSLDGAPLAFCFWLSSYLDFCFSSPAVRCTCIRFIFIHLFFMRNRISTDKSPSFHFRNGRAATSSSSFTVSSVSLCVLSLPGSGETHVAKHDLINRY